jgi:hypothetical protein
VHERVPRLFGPTRRRCVTESRDGVEVKQETTRARLTRVGPTEDSSGALYPAADRRAGTGQWPRGCISFVLRALAMGTYRNINRLLRQYFAKEPAFSRANGRGAPQRPAERCSAGRPPPRFECPCQNCTVAVQERSFTIKIKIIGFLSQRHRALTLGDLELCRPLACDRP